jgi:hypothetical protein
VKNLKVKAEQQRWFQGRLPWLLEIGEEMVENRTLKHSVEPGQQ